MSIQKVNHNVWHAIVDQALAAVGAGDNATSEWWDVNGWTDKRVSFEVDGANTDFDIEIEISPLGYYELNALTAASTLSTEHYESVNIVTAHNAQILASKDSSDVDELQRPFRSCRFVISNDSATAITASNVYLEGWS
jgi:hypothetical protein